MIKIRAWGNQHFGKIRSQIEEICFLLCTLISKHAKIKKPS